MAEVITITKEELKALIAAEVAKNSLPRKKPDFRDVMLRNEEISEINSNHLLIADRLSKEFASQQGEKSIKCSERNNWFSSNIYTRKRYLHGLKYQHYKTSNQDIHETLRKLSLNVLGATIIKDLDDDEFEYALDAYEKLKTCFLEIYADRISKEEVILSEISKVEV
ncbi:hypothetical protein [Streptococcus fryi]